ncbi:hypothetical protein E5329_10485 [Petralouisia muris]|jgi:hypothetical protein|uniref:Uncharacterized protein n=1 Tax=Petralouisia muris TaxID=3032872 RepID=A0AC61RWC5_9FIRM|nr:DUF6128 domain-containing protein [Petralouisia muris]TGY96266.1 hypothetical protein E5329_10485 [Petralouisia muris]
MSEFHRMITYLYLYEHGNKRHNVGFAKIEKRGGQCLVEIHMKNTGHNTSSAPVYFYASNRGTHPGILLGTMGLPRGNGDFKTILKGEPLADSEYSLDDIKGIFIPLSEEIMFVSQWDDSEFIRKNFVEPKHPSKESGSQGSENETPKPSAHPSGANGSLPQGSAANRSTAHRSTPSPAPNSGVNAPAEQNTANSSAAQSSANASAAQNPAAAQSSAAAQNPAVAHNPAAAQSSANASAAQNPATAQSSANASAARNSAAAQPEPTDSSSQANSAPSASPDLSAAEAVPNSREKFQGKNGIPLPSIPKLEPLPENWNLKWEFIMENYPVMTPFAEDDKTLCVRWELKDLRLLPRQYWYLGNNSFLLHGFFNYRYLILGVTEKAGKKRWFIGIPGVYQNPERVMATLFGFPEFRNEKSVPVNTGEFGYWYRYLNE